MTPVIFCRTHNIDGRRIHDFCDLNERGEVSLGECMVFLHVNMSSHRLHCKFMPRIINRWYLTTLTDCSERLDGSTQSWRVIRKRRVQAEQLIYLFPTCNASNATRNIHHSSTPSMVTSNSNLKHRDMSVTPVTSTRTSRNDPRNYRHPSPPRFQWRPQSL
jgi:hypothetical protein